MLHFFKISGNSLRPELNDGDIALALTWRRLFGIRPGARVLFRHPSYGLMVKKIDHRLPDGRLFVIGVHPASVDSYEFGPIGEEEVVGVVVMVFR